MNDVQTKLKKIEIKEYEDLISNIKPNPPVLKNFISAFVLGGLICLVAQLIFYYFNNNMGRIEAIAAMFIAVIFLGAVLTSLGIYKRIENYGGAGAIVPITGIANLMVASAIDYKREGYVLGIGARIFTTVGPILVFGFVISVLIGLVNFVFNT